MEYFHYITVPLPFLSFTLQGVCVDISISTRTDPNLQALFMQMALLLASPALNFPATEHHHPLPSTGDGDVYQ